MKSIAASVLVSITCFGCSASSTLNVTTRPVAETSTVTDPNVTLAIEPDGSLAWTVRVNTGGWSLATDRVELPPTGTARVFATLTRPASGEMVGQAFATLAGRHEASNGPIERAEFLVRRVVRGQPAIGEYERVAEASR